MPEERGVSSGLQSVNIAQALMEEDLERELARNEAANRMAKEREEQALAARNRAETSQKMMQEMMRKYELMREKLEYTKKHLDDTNEKISIQDKLTDKIIDMKTRVENYSNKREAVACLSQAVFLKAQLTDIGEQTSESNDKTNSEDEMTKCARGENTEGAEGRMANSEEAGASSTEGAKAVSSEGGKADSSKNGVMDEDLLLRTKERMERLKKNMEENEEKFKQREDLKNRLEEQVEKGEKRAADQARIAKAKEDLLALKMRELKLQQLRLARRQAQQDRKDLQMDHFFQQLDEIEKSPILLNQQNLEALKQAAEITLEINVKTESNPKEEITEPNKVEETNQEEIKQKNSISSETKIENDAESDNETEINTEMNTSHSDNNEINETTQEIIKESELEMKVENGEQRLESEISPANNNLELAEETRTKHEVFTNKSNKIQTENNKINHVVTKEATPVLGPETGAISKQRRPPSLETDIEPTAEQNTEEDTASAALSDTVRKIEGKCASVKGDLAEMAMSEQYLRTKQAMLLAKKKETEMKIAQNIASLREAEVLKMKEKVKHMQELLAQKREKLNIQEQIMKEKNTQETEINKVIEAKKRRGKYCEKELMEKIVFEKPSKKH